MSSFYRFKALVRLKGPCPACGATVSATLQSSHRGYPSIPKTVGADHEIMLDAHDGPCGLPCWGAARMSAGVSLVSSRGLLALPEAVRDAALGTPRVACYGLSGVSWSSYPTSRASPQIEGSGDGDASRRAMDGEILYAEGWLHGLPGRSCPICDSTDPVRVGDQSTLGGLRASWIRARTVALVALIKSDGVEAARRVGVWLGKLRARAERKMDPAVRKRSRGRKPSARADALEARRCMQRERRALRQARAAFLRESRFEIVEIRHGFGEAKPWPRRYRSRRPPPEPRG